MQEIDTRIAHSHHGHSTQFIEHDSSHRASPYYALLSIASAVLLTLSLYIGLVHIIGHVLFGMQPT